MKKKINIAFDIDETLFEIMPLTEVLLKEMYNVEILPLRGFEIKTFPEITETQLWSVFEEVYKRYDEVKPYDGVPELLNELYDLTGDSVRFITARPIWSVPYTKKLLNRYIDIPYNLFSVGSMSKLVPLYDIDYFADDRRKTAIELANNGKYVFVPKRDYNGGIKQKGVFYIDCISTLMQYVQYLIK